MVHVHSLILVLIQFALFVCVTCRSRSVGSHDAIVADSTCPILPNDNCSCSQGVAQGSNIMIIECYGFVSFPIFRALKIKNTTLQVQVYGTFGEVPHECISPLIGEGTYVDLDISGTRPYEYGYVMLHVDSKAFISDYAQSTGVTFSQYEFSSFPTEALSVNNIFFAHFEYCQMTVINNNSFYDFAGNELYISNDGIEEFEQYAFNGTGTLNTVTITENPFSRIGPAFKLIRTKQIDFRYGNISTIPDYAFCECNVLNGCTNIIHVLELSYNPLVSISDLAFANLPGLNSLIMDNCLLLKIPTIAINAVPSLSIVGLSNNLITEVEPNSFDGLPHLQRLNLQGNPIIVIQPGAFNGLSLSDLQIYDLDYLTSVDAAVMYGMNKVFDFHIYDCPKFEEITFNNYTQLPDSLIRITASSLNVKKVSSNLDLWLQLRYVNKLTISDNRNYNCTSDIRWMSKYVFCPHRQIVMDNTMCANTNQPLISYLQQLEPKPDCIQHSSATFLKNSSKLFTLCILLICFYPFSTFN